MKREPPFLQELRLSLRKSQMLALAAFGAGVMIGILLIAWQGELSVWALLPIALGACLSTALIWLQSRLIDMRYFPKIAQTRGLIAETSGGALLESLPHGIVAMGTAQAVANAVSGEISGQIWRAGFLECNHRELQTGSTKALFQGQLVQAELGTSLPDFVLRPKGIRLRQQLRITTLKLPKALEFSAAGQEWALHTADSLAADTLAAKSMAVLDQLPSPPKPAQLIGLFYAKGRMQILYANKRDLFSLWRGIFPALKAESAVKKSFEALYWAEITACALMQFDPPLSEETQERR